MFKGDLTKVERIYIPDDLLNEYKQGLLYSFDEKDEKNIEKSSSTQ